MGVFEKRRQARESDQNVMINIMQDGGSAASTSGPDVQESAKNTNRTGPIRATAIVNQYKVWAGGLVNKVSYFLKVRKSSK